MVIPNMVLKFNNFAIFYKICYIFDMSSALACLMESIKVPFVVMRHIFPVTAKVVIDEQDTI